MEKKKLELLITGVGVALFILLLVSTVSKRASKTPPPAPLAEQEAGVPKTEVKEEKPQTQAQWGRDPFSLAPQQQTTQAPGFSMTAVIWDEKNPLAVINGEVCCVGKEIDGYRVIEINNVSAVLKKGDKELVLELYE